MGQGNNNHNLQVGEKSRKSVIYRCNVCGNIHAFIVGETASVCEICQEKNRPHAWMPTRKEVMVIAKDIGKEMDRRRTKMDKVSDAITDSCGHINFVYLHAAWFGFWIIFNIFAPHPFDPYPFGLLTMIVSLEAIILATFIMISQNRHGQIIDMRSQMDFETNLKAEKNTAEILTMLKEIHADSTERN